MASKNVPFFARFLETQQPKVRTGVKAGAESGAQTTASADRETSKSPSDFDEMVTMKYPSDDDEYRWEY